MTRFEVAKFAREAYDLGVRVIGGIRIIIKSVWRDIQFLSEFQQTFVCNPTLINIKIQTISNLIAKYQPPKKVVTKRLYKIPLFAPT